MLLLGARDGTPLCFANRASLTPVLRQDPSKTSELKTVHRTVFLTLLTLLGFKSRLFLIRTNKNGVFTRNTPFPWCERRDLNPYGITTRPSNVRVCRFRHSRVSVPRKERDKLYHRNVRLSRLFFRIFRSLFIYLFLYHAGITRLKSSYHCI